MGEQTNISWTAHTFNSHWGCTRVSPGCENCYAETFDKRIGGDHWGPGKPRREFGPKHWAEPLKWNEKARRAGIPAKVFSGSMCDIFDDEAPAGARERLWDLARQTEHLIWQFLTKRPENIEKYFPRDLLSDPRIWLGITAENQPWLDKRWPYLRDAGPVVAWISYEPALGPLDLGDYRPDWLICGGESGNGFRPMQESWAENLRRQCAELGVAFFMKQMSARTPGAGKALIPPHLNVQQFPGESFQAKGRNHEDEPVRP
ncbi:MAG: DUF5131 family protein [Mycobacteriales bacterium]